MERGDAYLSDQGKVVLARSVDLFNSSFIITIIMFDG
jgi:hypothetical protein